MDHKTGDFVSAKQHLEVAPMASSQNAQALELEILYTLRTCLYSSDLSAAQRQLSATELALARGFAFRAAK